MTEKVVCTDETARNCPFCNSKCEIMSEGEYKRWSCPDYDCPGHNDNWWGCDFWDEGERRWNTRYYSII